VRWRRPRPFDNARKDTRGLSAGAPICATRKVEYRKGNFLFFWKILAQAGDVSRRVKGGRPVLIELDDEAADASEPNKKFSAMTSTCCSTVWWS